MTGKNPHWGPVGDETPTGDGDKVFSPCNVEWGRDVSGDGAGEYAPHLQLALLPSLNKGMVYYLVWMSGTLYAVEAWVAEPYHTRVFFPINVFDKLTIYMTSCSEVKEETGEEDGMQENSPRKIDKTLATLEAITVCLNWGQIFSLSYKTHQHMVIA